MSICSYLFSMDHFRFYDLKMPLVNGKVPYSGDILISVEMLNTYKSGNFQVRIRYFSCFLSRISAEGNKGSSF